MNETDTARWVAQQLKGHWRVSTTTHSGGLQVYITRKMLSPVTLAVVMADIVDAATVSRALIAVPTAEYVVSVPKGAYVSVSGISEAALRGVGVGAYSELLGALHTSATSAYVPPDLEFALRSIGQHSNVKSVTRLADRSVVVSRKFGETKTVAFGCGSFGTAVT